MSLVQIGGKVQEETKERFLTIRGEMTWEEILTELLNAYESRGDNPEIQQIPEGYISPEDHEQVHQLCENEIGRLKTAHTLEIEAKDRRIAELESELETAEMPNVEITDLTENQRIIEVSPFTEFCLADEVAAYKKHFKVDIEPGFLLCRYFLHMKQYGKVEPVYLWTEREFKQLEKRFETPPADE